MDLRNCKLIESCDRTEIIKKKAMFSNNSNPISPEPSQDKRKLPKISNSPTKQTKSALRYDNLQNNSLLYFAETIKQLTISCKKYKIPKLSPKEFLVKNKTKILPHKFVLATAADLSFSNYFRPKSLTPAYRSKYFSPNKPKKLKESIDFLSLKKMST